MSLTSRIRFDNKALRRLPIDPEQQNFTRQVASACFSRVIPTPVKEPIIVAVSPVALELLGLPRRVTSLVAPTSTIDSEQQSSSHEDQAEAAILAKDLPRYLSGNELLPGSETASHCYCGHQFGSFAGQLGDGAAIYLGEVVVASDASAGGGVAVAATRKATTLPNAASNNRWELQLKGAGPTPYSRSADGRKVLRSSLREFACSEIMFALGIPTTRAATLITSDSTVRRDPLYTGREIDEKCTVVSRIAESFIRFGSFEICKDADDETSREGPSVDDPTPLQKLFEYVAEELFTTVTNDAKQIVSTTTAANTAANKQSKSTATTNAPVKDITASGSFTEASWQSLAAVNIFTDIVHRTAKLVAQWQAVGWCHGVLNTDNMSIIGLTIDYGPYAFMTNYDEDFVCNLSDHSGRYSFKNQPAMCKWNLGKLAESWETLFPHHKATFDAAVENLFDKTFLDSYDKYMAAKLGFPAPVANTNNETPPVSAAAEDDENVPKKKVATMDDIYNAALVSIVDAFKETGADWTMTWRLLSKTPLENATEEDLVAVASAIANKHCCTPADRQTVLKRRMSHLRPQMSKEQIVQLTKVAETNPSALQHLFNGSVEPEALKLFLADQLQMWEDLSRTRDQIIVLKKYAENPSLKQEEDQKTWFAALARYKECLGAAGVVDSARMPRQLSSNPAFVLYPWILQDAIVKAETGSYSLVRNMVDRSMAPFDDDPRDEVMWSMAPPENAASLCVSCSS